MYIIQYDYQSSHSLVYDKKFFLTTPSLPGCRQSETAAVLCKSTGGPSLLHVLEPEIHLNDGCITHELRMRPHNLISDRFQQ